MRELSVNSFLFLFFAGVVVLISYSTEYIVEYVNDILVPCQHDSVLVDGKCACDNTNGVFGGQYCETCMCGHSGICAVTPKNRSSTSRWACRCPSSQKWVGTTCDNCYATEHTAENCRGDCVSSRAPPSYYHSGPQCNTVCMPDSNSMNLRCLEVIAGGGVCNACNGHGTCTGTGSCECDTGWFTSRDGEQCSKSCADADIPCEHGTCVAVGGDLQCVCDSGWFGPLCDQTCSANVTADSIPCSGHGVCGYNAQNNIQCTCDKRHIGEYCEYECPSSTEEACSGHGVCALDNQTATCTCSAGWASDDCSCSPTATCSGHGTCFPDGACDCFDMTEPTDAHWTGKSCEKCQDNWHGSNCQLYCDDAANYTSNGSTNGRRIGCNNHGSCNVIEKNMVEQVICVCDNTDPDTFCATCMPKYYPDIRLGNMSVNPCSVECDTATCSYYGKCNANYNGSNQLCICDPVVKNGHELHTLDADKFCSTCRNNWYPTTMGSEDRCSYYCASNGTITTENGVDVIKFGDADFTLQGDADAQEVCVANSEGYGADLEFSPDPDCRVCSGGGKCQSSGQCLCDPGHTGTYCEIDCNTVIIDGVATTCSGHGRCVRNDLELWFNPGSKSYRCECQPYDPYTTETRMRLMKRGFELAPPPSPDYYGEYCGFHCPRYNEEICAGRGTCTTAVAYDTYGQVQWCRNDTQCQQNTIEGEVRFCARTTTPWDSIDVDSQGVVSDVGFFGSAGAGYTACATDQSCYESILDIEWDRFCVNMLDGWYPSSMNTPTCAYSPACQAAVESFFVDPYAGNNTWCKQVEQELTPSMDVCHADAHKNATVYGEQSQPLCYGYTLDFTCGAQDSCIYDQSYSYIDEIDKQCASASDEDCTGACGFNNNNTCVVKTYCRAKHCRDIIDENALENICLDLDTPKNCSGSPEDWTRTCAQITEELQNHRFGRKGYNTTSDVFFSCAMYRQRDYPLRIEASIPGNIDITGVVTLADNKDVHVSALRRAFIDSRPALDASECRNDLDVLALDGFCDQHLSYLVPNAQPTANTPYIVYCNGHVDSLWSRSIFAVKRLQALQFNDCDIVNRTQSANYPPWTLDCLNRGPETSASFDLSLYPVDTWTSCTFKADEKLLEWSGGAAAEQCEAGMQAPWVERAQPAPTLCDLGACHPNDACYLCDDPSVTCESSADVFCVSEFGTSCESNRCQLGGTCSQGSMRLSPSYMCTFSDLPTASVTSQADACHTLTKTYNWYDECANLPDGQDLATHGGPGLKASWTTTGYVRAEDENTVVLSHPSSAKNIGQVHAIWLRQRDSAVEATCDGRQVRIYGQGIAVVDEKTIQLSEANRTVAPDMHVSMTDSYVYLYAPKCTWTLATIYGSTTLITLQLDGESAFIAFNETSVDGRRVDNGVTFDGDEMQIVRGSSALQNPDSCTVDASGKTNCAGAKPAFVGAYWDLAFQDNVRVSGWVRSFDMEQKVANVDVVDSEQSPVVSMYVYQHVVWLNGQNTGCTVNQQGRWWYWSLDVKSASAQTWGVDLHIDGCDLYNTTVSKTPSTLERRHVGRIAPSFHNMPSTRHGCRSACQGHADCVQWSHTPADKHCYLYSRRCHEDENCVDGTHTLHAFHPHVLAAVNVYNTALNSKTSWTLLRVDPLLSVPNDIASACAIPTEDLTEKWSVAFSEAYAPFSPDATRICRGFRTRWSTSPTTEDLKFCAGYQQYRAPASRPASCDDSTWTQYQSMNWTAYCGYRQSFDVKGDHVPFMGGPMCPGGACSGPSASVDMNTMCQVYDTIRGTTQCVSNDWYASCLGRTGMYRDYCSDACVEHITDMFASQGLCEKRRELMDMTVFPNKTETDIGKSCTQCDLGNTVLTDFCLLHGVYHRDNHILIPELSHSPCDSDCVGLLEEELSLNQWRGWCQSLANKTLPGVCSKTHCDCDVSYLGVAGTRCELSCPVGPDDGQELACSGRNGICVAENPDLLVEDMRQKTSDLREYRNLSSRVDLLPVWLKGPDPNMDGVCQCQLGSGLACSIPCDKCNNGTYGYSLASQYGICDSFNGICRGLAPFMRYDIQKASDLSLAYNSTSFKGTQWDAQYFLYESDASLFHLALAYLRDKKGEGIDGVPVNRTMTFRSTQELYDTLNIFRDVCYMRARDYETHGTYLNNSKKVTLNSLVFSAASTNQTLSSFHTSPIGRCVELHVEDGLYLCYANGTWSAYDNDKKSLYMRVTSPVQLPGDGVAFAQTTQSDLYMFGGNIGQTTINGVYRVSYRRVRWSPVDVVYVDVESVYTIGTAPPAQTGAWIWAMPNALYVLSENRCMYKLQFPTASTSYHEWMRESCQKLDTVQHIRQQGRDLFVYTVAPNKIQLAWTYANKTWQPGGPVRLPVRFEPEIRTHDIKGAQYACELNVGVAGVHIGNRTLATFENVKQLENVVVFSDDLVDIDPRTGADIATRVLNTVLWQKKGTATVPSQYETYEALDLVNRIYMHQGRWDIPTQFASRVGLTDTTRRVPPTGYTSHDAIMDGMASVNPDAFFKDVIVTTPMRLSISRTEGPQYQRKVAIYATRINPFESYVQTLALGTISLEFVLTWDDNIFNLQIKRPDTAGFINWKLTDAPYMTFALVIRLQAWKLTPEMFTSGMLTSSKSAEPGWARVFDMYVAEVELSQYNVVSRTSAFLAYTSSQCETTASGTCPSTLPYIGLPCSGRGRCNIACQCVCDAAPSVIEIDATALDRNQITLSPYRGDGCEYTCPGYDGHNISTVCNNRGECQRDGRCMCRPGFRGDACQFVCPKGVMGLACSGNGACGEISYEGSTYTTTQDEYTDNIVRTNAKSFSHAMHAYYDSCLDENFLPIAGHFENIAFQSLVDSSDVFSEATATCNDINRLLPYENYVDGQCIGLAVNNSRYVPMLLKSVQTESATFDTIDTFTCHIEDCSIQRGVDFSFVGAEHWLSGTKFGFELDYVHGFVNGSLDYIVNGVHVSFDVTWTPTSWSLQIADFHFVKPGEWSRVELEIYHGALDARLFPVVQPHYANTTNIFWAPDFMKNYLKMPTAPGSYYYSPVSDDTGAAMKLKYQRNATHQCDLDDKCSGILRWNSMRQGSYFQLLTRDLAHFKESRTPIDTDFTAAYSDEYGPGTTYAKMSKLYTGRKDTSTPCAPVEAGQTAYPAVDYTEIYNTPLSSVNLEAVQDPVLFRETGNAVIPVGDGIWTNCWTKYNANADFEPKMVEGDPACCKDNSCVCTKEGGCGGIDVNPDILCNKLGCYHRALQSHAYGFAWSEDTNICLVYTNITSPNNIQLNKWTDDAGRNDHNPCGKETTWYHLNE